MGIKDDQGGEDNQDITEEMDAHYQNAGKSSNGSALLYGVFALVVTLIVAAGLFFGGRAVYRSLTGTSGEEATQQEGQKTPEDTKNTQETNDNEGQTPGVSSDSTDNSDDYEDGQTGGSGGGASASMPSTGDNLPATGSPTGM